MARRSRWFACVGALSACVASLLLVPIPQASALASVRPLEWALDYFHADQLWAISKGAGVTVAVVDSGIEGDTRDLAGQLLPGASFAGGQSNGLSDTFGHGTSVAGIIGGTGANADGRGMYGLAPGVKLLSVQADVSDDVTDASLAGAIRYAADSSAKIINISIAMPAYSPDIDSATNYALAKGKLVIAGAGNDGTTLRLDPAGVPGVVAVSAIDQNSQPWSQSESGPDIGLAAPGVDIESTYLNNGYEHGDGTSYSTAFVSAAAALVWSKYPNLTAPQVIRQLITTADQKGASPRDQHYGFGVVDPLRALTTPPDTTDTTNPLLAAAAPTAPQSYVTFNYGASPSAGDSASAAPGAGTAAAAGTGGPSSGGGLLIALIVAVGAVAVLVAAVLAARRRRRAASAVAGTSPPGAGPPPGPPAGGPPPGRLG